MSTHTELINWHRLPGQLPDADMTVLVEAKHSDEIWPGYLDGDTWRWATGLPVTGKVLAWAHMPAGVKGVPL
jgi:hypothetical protein